jgi:hypothetical protein
MPRSSTKTFTATAQVEVGLGDFDEDTIAEYLRERGWHVADEEKSLSEFDESALVQELRERNCPHVLPEDLSLEALERIYVAFKTGQDKTAITLTRQLVQSLRGCATL